MSNYEVGRRFEYERAAYYRERGYTVMRTAGSHGPFDLVCLKEGEPALCVQCKVVATRKEADRLMEKFLVAGPSYGDIHERLDIKVKGNKDVWSRTI